MRIPRSLSAICFIGASFFAAELAAKSLPQSALAVWYGVASLLLGLVAFFTFLYGLLD
jgi:multidrug transporter EmrE-like cation transporter